MSVGTASCACCFLDFFFFSTVVQRVHFRPVAALDGFLLWMEQLVLQKDLGRWVLVWDPPLRQKDYMCQCRMVDIYGMG